MAREDASKAGDDLSLPRMLEGLSVSREVDLIYSGRAPAQRKTRIAVSGMSPEQRKLAEFLNLAMTVIAG